jgi:hypothetical protein
VRIAAAASAIVAATTLTPAAVAYASPLAPVPLAGTATQLGAATVDADPCAAPGATDPSCLVVSNAAVAATTGGFFWFGPANPNFQPLFGIVFPNFFGLNFEACLFGAAVHLSPYGTGFIGLGLGC